MLLDILYPVLWLAIAAIGLGLASRNWTQKAAKAFARAQMAEEQRAELLKGQLDQMSNLMTERLSQARAAASADEAQLRSQLALRLSELERATVERTQELQAQISQRLEHQFEMASQVSSARDATLLGEVTRRVAQLEAMIAERTAQILQVQAEKAESLPLRAAPIDSIDQRRRMDRLQNDVDFVKNHMSSYLGEGMGLTHLIDETPIYVNTNDYGCPSNFINGGRYEEDYYQVLASFRRPDSVFLDIGANLGVFSLRLAPLIRHGKVYAFEPNSKIYDLFLRSIHLNGFKNLIEVFKLGVSDRNAELALAVPDGHAGGASVQTVDSSYTGARIKVRRIDDLLADLSRFDLAKIDVEGHELNALHGMEELLRRSENAVVLFEKLNSNSGIEGPLLEFFAGMDMKIFRIDGLALVEIDLAQFRASEAYFLAARTSTISGEMVRNFINLLPGDLNAIACQVEDGALTAHSNLPVNSVIFHGPYWYLPRGSYKLSVVGKVSAGFKLVVAEKFGFLVAEFAVLADRLSFDFIVENDLTHFEVVARAGEAPFEFSIRRIRLTRVG